MNRIMARIDHVLVSSHDVSVEKFVITFLLGYLRLTQWCTNIRAPVYSKIVFSSCRHLVSDESNGLDLNRSIRLSIDAMIHNHLFDSIDLILWIDDAKRKYACCQCQREWIRSALRIKRLIQMKDRMNSGTTFVSHLCRRHYADELPMRDNRQIWLAL
jgi:hypothetical protein